MLVNLHVKDLALIKGVDISFGEGLNIITGETGAGKSIIIGSINIALGEKVSKDIIRENADYGFVELVFQEDEPKIKEKLNELDIPVEGDEIILSRKIMQGHSITKINGVTVPLSILRQVTAGLVDIHGQHDHQSLLNTTKHLEILDEFAGEKLYKIKEKLVSHYRQAKELEKELAAYDMEEDQRLREISFLEFEIEAIDNAALKEEEDIQLEADYKKLMNSGKIYDTLGKIRSSQVEDMLGEFLKEIESVSAYDPEIRGFYDQMMDMESTYRDLLREVYYYMENNVYDEQAFYELEKRLNLINKLKSKYGNSIDSILAYREESFRRLEMLTDLEAKKVSLEKELAISRNALKKTADELTDVRKKSAKALEKHIIEALKDLNFNQVQFSVEFHTLKDVSEKGMDKVEFLISTNPGEKIRSLSKAASGGELSRIMLAIKTILADKDDIDTLIFDEIDTGISGRTAQKVSEKLNYLGRKHQVICITHLAQIAAMADHHFMIEKKIFDNQTVTEIKELNKEESIGELSRILGGMEITDTVKKSAEEMKAQAKLLKMNQ